MAIYTLQPGQMQQIVYAAAGQRNPPATEYVISNLDQQFALYYGSADAEAQQPDLTTDLTRDILAPLQSVTVRANLDWWAASLDADDVLQVDVVPEGIQLSASPIDTAEAFVTAGVVVAIAQALSQAGLPLVANPVPLYDSSATTPNAAILFGTNAPSWTPEVNAGVTGLSTAIQYPSGFGPGITLVNGIPNTWPTGGFPVGVPIQIIDFAPDIPTTLSGANDARLAAFFGSAPNGSWVMPYHEANLKSNNLNPAQIQLLDNYLIAKVHAANPTLKYGRGFATYPVQFQGQDPTPWITPGMDFYGMDGYQASHAGATPDSVFDGTLQAILGVQANAQIAIIETNTALSVPTWFSEIGTYAIKNRLLAVQSFFGNLGPGGQPWQNSFAPAMNALSSQLAATGVVGTINPGATKLIQPLNPSPVAGYAIADSQSYDILVQLQAGAGSTNPFAKVHLSWFDNDATQTSGGIPVAEQQWFLPMAGSNQANPVKIQGVGPQRGAFLRVQITNEDTIACTAQVKLNSTTRTVTRDDWRWDIAGSSTVPGFTLAPDGAGFANEIAGVQARSVPAGGSLDYLCGLYAGNAYVRVETNANSAVVSATLRPLPDSSFNGTVLFNELIQGVGATGPGDFITEVILPRAPCLLHFANSDGVAHNVFAIITTED